MGHLHVVALWLPLVLLFLQIHKFCCTAKGYNSSISCIQREGNALLKFKGSLIDGANRLSSWTREDCCRWQGVRCNERTGHVVTLDLRNLIFFDYFRYYSDQNYSAYYRNNCLRGEISSALLNLDNLQYLDLSMNNFSSIQIPTFFGAFKYLRYLNLSRAGFHGKIPQQLGNISSLEYLDLSDNGIDNPRLTGRYNFLSARSLWWISQLSFLKYLDLSGADLAEAGDWLHAINMLPSLLSLKLAGCQLHTIASILQHVNITSLLSLDLSNNYLRSRIPYWFFTLRSLANLNLSMNEFQGPIPVMFGQLTNLTVLDLSENLLTASHPNAICALRNLVHMDLSYNSLQGALPLCIGKLTSLAVLNLKDNSLEGKIPSEIGHLGQLVELTLSKNELNGTIPSNLWHLENLQVLDISHNPLVGLLFEFHFMKLKDLKVLSISSTLLTFNLSSQWIPPFQLQEISMDSIPLGNFPSWLKTQTSVKTLSMSNASISDTLPYWFEVVYCRIHYLDLSLNQIKGTIPNFQTEINGVFRHIDLHSNRFQGSVKAFPLDIGLLDLSNNFLTGDIPHLRNKMSKLSQLLLLFLNDNRLTGKIPDYLCDIQGLISIDLSNNQLTGSLPLCLGNLHYLIALNMANNSLSGIIPSSIGNVATLRFLRLSKNKFQGKLPKELQNLKILRTLDLGENQLGGNIPEWINKEFSELVVLRLQYNNFSGDIPQHLCHLPSLQLLNAAQNQITGRIPRCFSKLSAMASRDIAWGFTAFYGIHQVVELSNIMKGREYVYTTTLRYLKAIVLSGNNIVGEIPEELMVLEGLQGLILSNNRLSGHIPDNIGNLKQLESLDLSSNKLSGSIPPSLANVHSLGYLNLSFNNLSGRIPQGRQLQTLDYPSIYEGNNGLCGYPLQNCPDYTSPDTNRSTTRYEEGEEFNWPWFFAGIGQGFTVGLLAVLCILHFKKSWRYAYFQFVDNVYNKLWVAIALKTSQLRRRK